jgi:Ser/Thr protein kinase RdoA (MazF antagonist)
MQDLLRVLVQWPVTRQGAVVSPAPSRGLSGAGVWKVAADGEEFALRRWPHQMHAEQLSLIHTVQALLGAYGPPVVPRLQYTESGATLVTMEDCFWELATWRPGFADFRAQPTPARLRGAMRTLAHIHQTANERIVTPWPLHLELDYGRAVASSQRLRSKSAHRRALRLGELVKAEGQAALHNALARTPPELTPLVRDGIALIRELAPMEHAKSLHWQRQDLALQYRLGDVHHDHVLFVGDEVTGIIDFGAVDFDSPAGDVARLLGSLVGDDREQWAQGLEAYRSVWRLTPLEAEAAAYFHTSGMVIAAANWIGWLWPSYLAQAPEIPDRATAVERLRWLVERLRVLATWARG